MVSFEGMARQRKPIADETLRTDLTAQVGTIDPIPSKFFEFASLVGLALTPAQEVMVRVAYDGEDSSTFEPRLRDIAQEVFGFVGPVTEELRRVVVAVCGARSGKSLVFVAARLLHLALTVDVSGLGPGEVGYSLIVAPDLRLSKQTLRYAQGMASQCKAVGDRVIEGIRGGTGVLDGFVLQRENDRQVHMICLPATRGGSAIRGRSYVGAALDEAAFFRDDNAVVNDDEVFGAAMARLLVGGQCIVASTAWEESGLLFKEFKANFGKPVSALAVHAPTTLMRPDEVTVKWVETERKRDPDNAEREYDAVFMTGNGAAFFSPQVVDRCIDVGREGSLRVSKSGVVSIGCDFAFRKDSSALVVCERLGDTIHVGEPLELRPTRDAPLKPSEVCAEFAKVCRAYRVESVIADSHYLEAVREHLATWGIGVVAAPEGVEAKMRAHILLRDAMIEGRVRLPDSLRFVAQLKSIQKRPQPGGNITITAPRTSGGHGDIVSALVLAASRLLTGAKPYSSLTVPSRFQPVSSQNDAARWRDLPEEDGVF